MTDPADTNSRLEAFLAGIDQLPPWGGIAWRGFTGDATLGFSVPTVVTQGITAASADVRVATSDFTTPGVYAILSQTARDLSPMSAAPHEHELVFAPGTIMQSQGSLEVDGCRVVVVFELLTQEGRIIGPTADKTRIAADVTAALRDARARGPVGPTRDRYIGDIW
jgi:hypothetical protein